MSSRALGPSRSFEHAVFAVAMSAAAAGCQRDAVAPPAAGEVAESIGDLEEACDGGAADACERLAARLLIGSGVPADASEARRRRWQALALHAEACARREQASCEELPAHLRTVVVEAPVQSASPVAALPLDLPKAASGAAVDSVIEVDLDADGALFVDGQPKDDGALGELAKQRCGGDGQTRVVIRADQAVRHRRVIEVLDLVKQGGCSKIAFGVAPERSP